MKLLAWVVGFAWMLLLGSAQTAHALMFENTARIAIVSALRWEQLPLLELLTETQTVSLRGVEFTTGLLHGKPVVLFYTGASMVNASMVTQFALDHFNISHLIFVGIAGGLSSDLQVGDVVVAEKWAQYQEQTIPRLTLDGTHDLPTWHSATLPAWEIFYPKTVHVRGQTQTQTWFSVDATLYQHAQTTAESFPSRVILGGAGVSGQAYVNHAGYGAYLHMTFDEAKIVDMESAGVAQVALFNQVPFLAIRGVSDVIGGDNLQIAQNLLTVSAQTAQFVSAFVKTL